jgi:hypothetical protein
VAELFLALEGLTMAPRIQARCLEVEGETRSPRSLFDLTVCQVTLTAPDFFRTPIKVKTADFPVLSAYIGCVAPAR